MNTAFLLITTAWLAGAGPGTDYGWDGWSYASYWASDGSYGDVSPVLPCGYDDSFILPCGYEDSFVLPCCYEDSFVLPCGYDDSLVLPCGYDGGSWDGPGTDWCPGGDGEWCGPAPRYNWGCQPSAPREGCLKRLCHHFHHKEPCDYSCYNPYSEPCFQDYYASSCCAASGCCDTGKHCLFHRKKHHPHEQDCAPPCGPYGWGPGYPPCGFCDEGCEITFHKGHCGCHHHPHCGHCHHHHKHHHHPAPCCALSCAPYADCCPVCSDGCCGAFDDWSGDCADGSCGAEYGGPCYGVEPKAAPTPAPCTSEPPTKPEKIAGPKTPKDGSSKTPKDGGSKKPQDD